MPPTVAKTQAMTLAVMGHAWTEFVVKYSESYAIKRVKTDSGNEYFKHELVKQIGLKQFQSSLGVSIFESVIKVDAVCCVNLFFAMEPI